MKSMDPSARSLISAARPAEVPTDADRARIRARVLAKVAGAGALVAAASAANPAAGAGAAPTAAAKAIATANVSAAGAGVLGKAVLIGVLSAFVSIGAFEVWDAGGRDDSAVVVPSAPSRFEPTPAVQGVAESVPSAGLPPPADVLPLSDSAADGENTASSRRVQPQARVPTERPARLRDEIHLLKEAQEALAAGDRTRALALFEAHERRFENGALRAERLAGRAIALCSAGPSAEANRAATEFFAAPGSALLEARVRAACAIAIGGSAIDAGATMQSAPVGTP